MRGKSVILPLLGQVKERMRSLRLRVVGLAPPFFLVCCRGGQEGTQKHQLLLILLVLGLAGGGLRAFEAFGPGVFGPTDTPCAFGDTASTNHNQNSLSSRRCAARAWTPRSFTSSKQRVPSTLEASPKGVPPKPTPTPPKPLFINNNPNPNPKTQTHRHRLPTETLRQYGGEPRRRDQHPGG
jgi:hypothetical protein